MVYNRYSQCVPLRFIVFFSIPSVKMAPKDKQIVSKLPEIMAQITQTLSESFEKMAEALFIRVQSQGKELVGEVTNEVKDIKAEVDEVRKDIKAEVEEVRKDIKVEVEEVRKDIKAEVDEVKKDVEEVKKEVIKAQPVPSPVPEAEFEVRHERNPKFLGRSEELGRLFELWKPGQRGRIAVVGLGGIG